MMSTHSRNTILPCRLKCFDAKSSSKELLVEYYKSNQILHIRGGGGNIVGAGNDFNRASISKLYEKRPDIFNNTWSIENQGNMSAYELQPDILFGPKISAEDNNIRSSQQFYVSFILQEEMVSGSSSSDFMVNCLSSLPVPLPPLIQDVTDATHTSPIWVFYGENNSRNGGNRCSTMMKGRVEHTDSVTHTGTWHYQASGEKVWHVRPQLSHQEWGRYSPFRDGMIMRRLRLRERRNCFKTGTAGTRNGKSDGEFRALKSHQVASDCSVHFASRTSRRYPDRQRRMRIHCRAGDLLFINTRLWWHYTEIPGTKTAKGGESISYARDFHCPSLDRGVSERKAKEGRSKVVAAGENEMEDCKTHSDSVMANVEGVYASRNIRKGDIVLTEDDLPDCSLPRSQYPNCEVVELDDGRGALRALKPLQSGDWLAVAYSDDEEDEDE